MWGGRGVRIGVGEPSQGPERRARARLRGVGAPQKEIVGIGWEAAVLKQAEQVVELAVDVAADLDGCLQLQQGRLCQDYAGRLLDDVRDLVGREADIGARLLCAGARRCWLSISGPAGGGHEECRQRGRGGGGGGGGKRTVASGKQLIDDGVDLVGHPGGASAGRWKDLGRAKVRPPRSKRSLCFCFAQQGSEKQNPRPNEERAKHQTTHQMRGLKPRSDATDLGRKRLRRPLPLTVGTCGLQNSHGAVKLSKKLENRRFSGTFWA